MRHLVLVFAVAVAVAGCGGGSGGGGSSPSPDPVPPNSPPTADAGSDVSGSLDASGIELDGSGSGDPDGDTLSYSWSVETQPDGAGATLTDADTARPSLSTLVPGHYVVELTVNDGNGGTARDSVALDLVNDAPVLALEATQAQIAIGMPAGLDASGSSDPNGHALSYEWVLATAPGGSNLRSGFTGPAPLVEFDVTGNFEFRVEVSDGYATDTQTVAFSVSTYTERVMDEGFVYLEADADGELTAVSEGSTVRILGDDGTTAQTFSLPATVIHLAVSPNGEWIGAAHLDRVSIIDVTTSTVAGTWDVSQEPGDIIIDNDGYVHLFPRFGQWVSVFTINPETGVETAASARVRQQTIVRAHPNGMKAYGADNGLSPSDIERYDISSGALTYAYDSPYHGDYPFCGDLWIADSGNEILTACGAVVLSTDDPSTDMTFRTQIARVGTILDAAYQTSTGYWYVIEDTGSDIQLNVYDGAGGQWQMTLELPELSPGVPATPMRVVTGQSSEFVRIFAADHPTNPQVYGVFTRSPVDEGVLDFPPVTVVPGSTAGFVGDTVRLDASGSYDPEGATVEFTWSLVSQPAQSDVQLSGAGQPAVEFTPSHEGEYVLSLVTDDGDRMAAAETIAVQVVAAGSALQFGLEGAPSDIVYNKAAHQILYTASDRGELRIRNLDDFSEWVVELARPGEAVDVSPNGEYAAVSHTGLASLIELRPDGASVIDTQDVSADWGDIVIDDRGIAYTVPIRDQHVDFLAIDFARDTVFSLRGARAGTQLRMLPAGGAVYGADRGLSPSDIEHYTVRDIENMTLRDSRYHGDYSMAGNLWINEQSDRILVAGGFAFQASDDPNRDMLYVETLSPAVRPVWADHSEEAGRWAIVANNAVTLFGDTTYNQVGTVDVDTLFIDSAGTSPAIDRVFHSDDGNMLIVVAHSEAIGEDNYVVQIIE